jgi:hypothetical protein
MIKDNGSMYCGAVPVAMNMVRMVPIFFSANVHTTMAERRRWHIDCDNQGRSPGCLKSFRVFSLGVISPGQILRPSMGCLNAFSIRAAVSIILS